MYKLLPYIALIFLIGSFTSTQPPTQVTQECIELADTIIDGDHIRLKVSPPDSMANIYLHLYHNDLDDSLILKNFYFDIDFKEDLLFMNKQKQLINTWIAKTNSLVIFVLPYYPAIGLYAYKIDDNKIKFITTSDNFPIYSDYAFFARFDSDMVTSCFQPSARNTYGATLWKYIESQHKFVDIKSIAHDTYLSTDSVKFIHIFDSIHLKCK